MPALPAGIVSDVLVQSEVLQVDQALYGTCSAPAVLPEAGQAASSQQHGCVPSCPENRDQWQHNSQYSDGGT